MDKIDMEYFEMLSGEVSDTGGMLQGLAALFHCESAKISLELNPNAACGIELILKDMAAHLDDISRNLTDAARKTANLTVVNP